MNINDINEDILKTLRINGVNRLSIGVESFNKYNLKFLNRKHSSKQINETIKLVKSYGFNNFNIDLIYALPIENIGVLKSDIKKVLKLGPTHISTYSLIIEENTALYINNIKSIDEEIDYKMYNYICKKLKSKKYIHYEISNFALEGYESRHNLKYWDNEEYYGFGLGAHGYIDGVRYENTRSLNKYLSENIKLKEIYLSKKEDMENEIMLGLRKIKGINIQDFYEKFHVNIQDEFNINETLKKEYIEYIDGNIRIKKDKLYLMNEILNEIMKNS
jgi:oxygen-independent coproporphyrinogen-3 oxidase